MQNKKFKTQDIDKKLQLALIYGGASRLRLSEI
jgi:hypothetical protein